MHIGKAILKDIEDLFVSNTFKQFLDGDMEDIMMNHISHINFNAQNPDGSQRVPLGALHSKHKEQAGRLPIPDLYYTGAAEHFLYAEANQQESSLGFDYGNAEVGGYMTDHEMGGGGMPVRRQFPVNDPQSGQADDYSLRMIHDEVLEALGKVLNSSRVVTVG